MAISRTKPGKVPIKSETPVFQSISYVVKNREPNQGGYFTGLLSTKNSKNSGFYENDTKKTKSQKYPPR